MCIDLHKISSLLLHVSNLTIRQHDFLRIRNKGFLEGTHFYPETRIHIFIDIDTLD